MRLPAAALLVAALLASPAGGAPPSCLLVADPKGDLKVDDDALDVVSADVASDGTSFTVAIRVADLTTPASTSPAGANYTLSLRLPEARLEFLASLAVTHPPQYVVRTRSTHGTSDAWLDLAGASVSDRVTGVVDTARDEIRVTVPMADLARYGGRPGARAESLHVMTWRTVPLVVDTFVASEDWADGTRSYKLGTPSCLTPGR